MADDIVEGAPRRRSRGGRGSRARNAAARPRLRNLVPTSAERIALGLDTVLSSVLAGGRRVVLFMRLEDGDFCVANGFVDPGTNRVEKVLGSVRFVPDQAGKIEAAARAAVTAFGGG